MGSVANALVVGNRSGEAQPYVGAVPFRRSDEWRFFGRDDEAEDLVSRILAHPVVLLYGQSGVGKTSLINARLIPLLERDEECQVFEPARVTGPIPAEFDAGRLRNIFMFHALDSWKKPGQDWRDIAPLTLAEMLGDIPHRYEKLEIPGFRVLIFEQFEEIFTNRAAGQQERTEFFQQVREALAKDRLLRVVLAMREDYIAEMEPFARFLPDGFRTSYRLECLRKRAALQALTRPLEGTGIQFAPGVADSVISNLATERLVDHTGAVREAEGEFVQPVQLGVVSEFLWQRFSGVGGKVITADLGVCAGSVDEALQQFYEQCIRSASAAVEDVSEGQLRKFFQEVLITAEGVRALCLRGKEYTEGIPNKAIDLLAKLHLIKPEWRGSAAWYELTHDRFISPIQQSNRDWVRNRVRPEFLEKRDALESRALTWQSRGRKLADLFRDRDLKEAEALLMSPHAADLGISAALRACVEASRTAMQIRQLKRLRRQRTVLIVQREKAELRALQARRASVYSELMRIGGEVGRVKSNGQDATELSEQLDRKEKELRDADEALSKAMKAAQKAGIPIEAEHWIEEAGLHKLEGHSGQVFGLAYSRAGSLVSAGADGTARVWNSSGKLVAVLKGHTQPVTAALFCPDGTHVVTASHDGTAKLWSVSPAKEIRTFSGHTDRIWGLAVSPDGMSIATAAEDKTVRLWEVQTGRTTRVLPSTDSVFAVAFSGDGRLATGGADRAVTIWDVKSGKKLRMPEEHGDKWVWSVAFSPDNRTIASAGFDGRVVLHNGPGPTKILTPSQPGQLGIVTFNSSGDMIAVGSSSGSITIWDPRSGNRIRTLDGHGAPLYGVAFDPDGNQLATGSQHGAVFVFPLRRGARRMPAPGDA